MKTRRTKISSGRPLSHVEILPIPEPWQSHYGAMQWAVDQHIFKDKPWIKGRITIN